MNKILTFTLEQNCLINLQDKTGQHIALGKLVDAHNQGRARVFIAAISASERTRDANQKPDYTRFRALLDRLSLESLPEVLPIAYWDIAFWDHALWSGDNMVGQERKIHGILFPAIEFEYADYCKARGVDPAAPKERKWLNAKCDVQAMWSHINAANDVFVTEDQNFFKQSKKYKLIDLGAKAICTPEEAAALLTP
jgi:hypothetical protein